MRRIPLLIILAAVLTLIFQLTFMRHLEVISLKPDLMFIWVVLTAFYLPLRATVFISWLLGMLVDLTSNSALGTFGLLYLLNGLVILFLRQMFFREDFITRLSVTFVFSWFCQFLYGVGLSLFKGAALGFWFVLFKSFGIALYTTLAALLVFILFDFITHLILARRLREELK